MSNLAFCQTHKCIECYFPVYNDEYDECPECGGELENIFKKEHEEFIEEENKSLKMYLESIETFDKNNDYDNRNNFILAALNFCIALGYECGIRVDPKEPEWPVVFMELPTGQVSWHLSQHEKEWDGHSTEKKYKRIKEFCE
jgi:hypothetical protein